MAEGILKCKTCGRLINLSEAVNGVVCCDYCNNHYTVPKKETSPDALNFLRQGEHDLDTCRFDDAYAAYSKAAEYDGQEPEAYWGMALAEFKVQYIKDGVEKRLQPICHEFAEKQFTRNRNYLSALKYATEEQKEEYAKKAGEIDYIRSEFLRLKQTGLDYDCFICVKVSDTDNERTGDSRKNWTEDAYVADEIYDLLKEKGYTPFFSEREIKGRTGVDYEALILYALYTSETMLVVCRDEKYLQTKWVKNEYTRFKELVNSEEKENDSLTIVYSGTPIEKLPGSNGKIQGIDYKRRTSAVELLDFVEKHTPRAQEKKKKAKQENEEFIRKAVEKMLADQRDAGSSVKRQEDSAEQDLKLLVIDEDTVIKCKDQKATKVIIPRFIKRIDKDAFQNCTALENVILPDGLLSIGRNAFGGCHRLRSLRIPEGVTKIESDTFCFCENLESVTIPSSVTSIGESAFRACNLKSITIPNGVTRIGESAFA